MPRGSRDGSIIRRKAEIESNGRTSQSAGITVRKRYTDLKGRRREKKRAGSSLSEAHRLMREIEHEIEVELTGMIKPSQGSTFTKLLSCCLAGDFTPAEQLVAMLLQIEAGVRTAERTLPPLSAVRLADYCNPLIFKPAQYFAALVDALEAGLCGEEELQPAIAGSNDPWYH